MKKKFIRFLKNRRLYSAFIRNISSNECNGVKTDKPDHVSVIMYITSSVHAESFIAAAFRWKLTPEGFKFWEDLELEWLTELT